MSQLPRLLKDETNVTRIHDLTDVIATTVGLTIYRPILVLLYQDGKYVKHHYGSGYRSECSHTVWEPEGRTKLVLDTTVLLIVDAYEMEYQRLKLLSTSTPPVVQPETDKVTTQ